MRPALDEEPPTRAASRAGRRCAPRPHPPWRRADARSRHVGRPFPASPLNGRGSPAARPRAAAAAAAAAVSAAALSGRQRAQRASRRRRRRHQQAVAHRLEPRRRARQGESAIDARWCSNASASSSRGRPTERRRRPAQLASRAGPHPREQGVGPDGGAGGEPAGTGAAHPHRNFSWWSSVGGDATASDAATATTRRCAIGRINGRTAALSGPARSAHLAHRGAAVKLREGAKSSAPSVYRSPSPRTREAERAMDPRTQPSPRRTPPTTARRARRRRRPKKSRKSAIGEEEEKKEAQTRQQPATAARARRRPSRRPLRPARCCSAAARRLLRSAPARAARWRRRQRRSRR